MRKKMMYFACVMTLTLFLAGCGDQGKKAETTSPADHATTMSSPSASAPTAMVTGTIKETMNAGQFTYILLEQADGSAPAWYAMPEISVKTGDSITIQSGNIFNDFYSKALDRTFESVIFSQGPAGAAGNASPHATSMMHGSQDAASPHGGAASGSFADAVKNAENNGSTLLDPNLSSPGSNNAIVPFAELKIAKASGDNAYTVSEVFSKAAELNTKKIRVQGQVMKISRMIMGKNWIHIQDGTGDPTNDTHDLVVTTMAEPSNGDTITIEGTLSADKDFGSGYHYDAIVEDATISK